MLVEYYKLKQVLVLNKNKKTLSSTETKHCYRLKCYVLNNIILLESFTLLFVHTE